jgi:tRNA(Ile)-lysidine synthase
MEAVLKALTSFLCEQPEPYRLVVAFSGGRDSHVLLHALWQLRQKGFPIQLEAIHVDHGLFSASGSWALHCQSVCQQYQIPLETVSLKLQIMPGESVEAVAREKRYGALTNAMEPSQLLLTAHHLEDQAESLLLQLLRGAGIKGLSAMGKTKMLNNIQLARPLLDVSSQDIADYALHHQLNWVEDISNQNKRFTRNFLRLDIFPMLEKTYPGAAKCLARSAYHCANSQKLLDEYLKEEVALCLGDAPKTLNLLRLKQYSPLKQPHILRYWLQQEGASLPSLKKLETILKQMITAKMDANPCIRFGNTELRRFKDVLFLRLEPCAPQSNEMHVWDYHFPLKVQNGQAFRASRVLGRGISLKKLESKLLKVAFRQGGERCRKSGDPFSRSLKKIFQEMAIPPWERPYVPLFYHEENLVGVGDLFICEGWQAQNPCDEGLVVEKIDDVG